MTALAETETVPLKAAYGRVLASDITAPISTVVPECANQIGATHGLYTTDDSVYDIEQIGRRYQVSAAMRSCP